MVETAYMRHCARLMEREDFERNFRREHGRYPTVEELGEFADVRYD